jgi:FxsC-like protein
VPDAGSPAGPLDSCVHAVLALRKDLDAMSIAEALWLAANGWDADAESQVRPPPPEGEEGAAEAGDQKPADDGPPDGRDGQAPPRSRGGTAAPGRLVRVGPATPFPQRLQLERSLRPFKRPWKRGGRTRLDLDATVHAYTRTGQLIPVLRPAPERWFDAAVVRDDAPSMAIWADETSGLSQVLRQAGTFRTVRDFRLSLTGPGGTADPPPGLTSEAGSRSHPGRLRAPDSRRLIVIVTDGVAPGWRRPEVWRTVRAWAASTPTVLVSPLGVRMWRQTGLDLPTAHVGPAAPGSRNAALRFTVPFYLREPGQRSGDWLPVPAVTLSPHRLRSWARTLMRADPAGCEALLIPPSGRAEGEAGGTTPPVDRDSVAAFLRLSSGPAARLAVLCSPFKTVSLPLLRLIGQDLVPAAATEDIAELLISGLFLAPEAGADGPQFPFHDEARAVLQDRLADADLWRVYDVLRSHVNDGAGTAGTFTAAVRDPAGDVAVPAGDGLDAAALDLLELLGVLPAGVPVIEAEPLPETVSGSPAAGPAVTGPPPQSGTSPATTATTRESGAPAPRPAAKPTPVRTPELVSAGGPLFYLSYAHSPRGDDDTNPDVWVEQLYRDLNGHVRELADLSRGQQPGFMDRELHAGSEWPSQLSDALATCRVFVPLYSRRYFRSEHCGKEWFAFASRGLSRSYLSAAPVLVPIVPALWIPLPSELIPEAARSVQYMSRDFDPLYAEHGFYGIMKVRRWRDAYEEAVYRLARRIVEVAETSPAEPGIPVPYESLPAAFGGLGDTGPGDKVLRVTVVAPSRDDLPKDRDLSYYGPAVLDWNPFPQEAVRPLGTHAAEIARALSYRPVVGDLLQDAAELLGDGAPPGPQVLLIDPWAVLRPEYRDLLRRLDQMNKPWVQVLVVWNQGDEQMRADTKRLREGLDDALPRWLDRSRATSVAAARGVSSRKEFGLVFPSVIATAGRHYLRRAAASPPEPAPEQRPRLSEDD